MKKRKHTLVVEIMCDTPIGQRQAQDALYAWLEYYGHPSIPHNFQFVSVGVMTGKRLTAAPRIHDDKDPLYQGK